MMNFGESNPHFLPCILNILQLKSCMCFCIPLILFFFYMECMLYFFMRKIYCHKHGGYKAVDDLKRLCMGVTLFVNTKRKLIH